MKGFFKFILSVFTFFAAAVGALAIVDSLLNKNRIKGEYLNCDSGSEEEP